MKKLIFLFGLLLTFGLGKAQMQDPVHWKFSMTDVSKTEKELQFTAKIDDHWHVYGLHIPEDGPNPTTFTFTSVEGAELVGEVTSPSKLITKYDETFGMELNWYEKEVTFIQRIKLTGENFTVKGYLRYMTCDDQSCLPPTSEEFEFTGKGLSAADLAATAAKAAPKKEVKKESAKPAEKKNNEPKQNVAQPAEKTAETAKPTSNEVTTATTPTAQTTTTDLWTPVIDKLQARGETTTTTDTSLWFLFFSGFVGGLLALLTPCVWPMIPMTVSFFLKRSNNRNRSIRDAIIYGLAIIIIYVGLGLLITAIFGASALNSLATNAVFNILFFALLVVFAISFFGAFELTLPAKWSTAVDSKAEATSGLLSIFLMAFTLSLVSFSCTGPIIGFLLVQVSTTGSVVAPAIGMLGFAIALALPFTLFALFPSWLKSMPKSGGWMNVIKVTLGFLELAFALKFLSVADLAYGWRILDRETFLALWIVIFALLGFYLLGKIKFPHDDDDTKVSVSRFFMALVSLAFAVYMVPGLWGAPLKAVSAFAPPMKTQDFNLYTNEVHAKFDDYDLGMEYARQHNKPVMLDFTGYGCVNCRKMELAVWTDPKVSSIINNDYVLITLYVDNKTPLTEPVKIMENGTERTLRTVGDKWSYLQRVKFGANAQPFYVLIDNEGNPLNKSYAYDEDISKYINFLQTGLENYRKEK